MTNSQNNILWRFSPIPSIEESTFNGVLEKFYNMGISGLVRENIQNSLDARNTESSGPVVVTIKTGKINQKYIPGIDEIQARISCLQGHNTYTKETIEHMIKKMDQEVVSYISFEDSNTKGLKGAKNGQSELKEDTLGIYAYNKGVHVVEEDESLERSRGGSHGIGKISSNAASDLYMMYFANCDEEGNQHLGGTVQLMEHKYHNSYYRSTGYFTDIKSLAENKTKFYPFENNFHQIFSKNTRGLKIIIPFLRDQFNSQKDIIKSVCDSFFIAIIQEKLEVIVNNCHINCNSIRDFILSEDYYLQEFSEIRNEFTPIYYDTYSNIEPILLEISDRNNKYRFNLYFQYNDKISKGRVAIIRTIGMKIEDKKINGNINKPFNAILIPESTSEDVFLKSLENESHTQLSFEHIKDQDLQKNAKRFINNISREISKIIEEEMKKNNPTDGLMNTEDILYVVESQFRQDLSQATPTVNINKGNKRKIIVKVPTIKPKGGNNGDGGEGTKKKRVKTKRVGKDKRDGEGNQINKMRYRPHPDMIERVVIGDKELVRLDFSDSEDLKNEKLCDITLSVVDGMGAEYYNEFSLNDNYKNVIDSSTGKKCEIDNNLIKDIEIKNGISQIELELKDQFNKALKFVYYIEV